MLAEEILFLATKICHPGIARYQYNTPDEFELVATYL
jgi:hypothetical protein